MKSFLIYKKGELKMNCEDLMNMKQIQEGMKLVAGETGINRTVRWIYFADCVQCLKDAVNVAELIHGEELVIVTNESLTEDDEKIIDMIRKMSEKNIAGFVINEGQISKKVTEYCNDIELPLFELSVSLHLIDLSQIVCKALVEEESNTNSRERLLSSILYSDNLNVEEVVEHANYLGVNLVGKYRAILFWLYDAEDSASKDKYAEQGYQMEMHENIKKCIKSEFRTYGVRRLLILSQIDTVVVLIPSGLFSRDLLVTILNSTRSKVEGNYHIKLKVGIGTAYEYIEDFKKSYQEAKNTLAISKIVTEEYSVYFYEDLGIYSLIAQITNGKFLDDYVESRIGKLIKADQMQAGELCETLEAYLEHNCNAYETAGALFVHRNTMRYRLDKIKNILEYDINSMSVCLELKLAFAIKRYRENREEA